MTDLYDAIWTRLKNAAREYATGPSSFANDEEHVACKIIEEMSPGVRPEARDCIGEFQAMEEKDSRERALPIADAASGVGAITTLAPEPGTA